MLATEFTSDTFYPLAGGSLELDDQHHVVMLALDAVHP